MTINKNIVIELLLFGLSGFIGYLVDASVTILLSNFLEPYLARIPAFIFAATATWALNRNYTFRKNSSKYNNLAIEYLHYTILMILGIFVNYLVFLIILLFIPNNTINVLLSIAIGSLAGMLVNFINAKKYIFKNAK